MIKAGGRGKSFEALIIYSFNSSGESFALRLREGVKGAFCMRCKNYINLSHMSRQQPFDYVVMHQGRPFALEAKSVHGVSFPLRNIKDHQIQALEKFEEHGSAHVFLEFIPGKNRPKKYVLVPIKVFLELIAFCREAKRESVPLAKLDECIANGTAREIVLAKNAAGKPALIMTSVLNEISLERWPGLVQL